MMNSTNLFAITTTGLCTLPGVKSLSDCSICKDWTSVRVGFWNGLTAEVSCHPDPLIDSGNGNLWWEVTISSGKEELYNRSASGYMDPSDVIDCCRKAALLTPDGRGFRVRPKRIWKSRH